MTNKEFFIPGKNYRYVGEGRERYWTPGEIYKCFYLYNDDKWVELQVDEGTSSIRHEKIQANGLGDGFWWKPVNEIWELVHDKKEHLPEWF